MKKHVFVDFKRCVNCLACEVACQREHAGFSLIRIVVVDDYFAVPLTCRHCDPAPCISACPTRALCSNGAGLSLDPEKCNGCTLCVFACPFGMMRFGNAATFPAACDGCAGRTARGLEPACVTTCPTGALRYGDYESVMATGRHHASAEIVRAQPGINTES